MKFLPIVAEEILIHHILTKAAFLVPNMLGIVHR